MANPGDLPCPACGCVRKPVLNPPHRDFLCSRCLARVEPLHGWLFRSFRLTAILVYLAAWVPLLIFGLGFVGLPLFLLYDIIFVKSFTAFDVVGWKTIPPPKQFGQLTYLELLGIICVAATVLTLLVDYEHGFRTLGDLATVLSAVAIIRELWLTFAPNPPAAEAQRTANENEVKTEHLEPAENNSN
jgi:hypothetical protein